jgi:hypothetical protein
MRLAPAGRSPRRVERDAVLTVLGEAVLYRLVLLLRCEQPYAEKHEEENECERKEARQDALVLVGSLSIAS